MEINMRLLLIVYKDEDKLSKFIRSSECNVWNKLSNGYNVNNRIITLIYNC